MPRGKKVRAKSVVTLMASKQLQNVILILLESRDVHQRYFTDRICPSVPDDLPSFSSLKLECDVKDGDDRPHQHQNPYRKTHPPVRGLGRERPKQGYHRYFSAAQGNYVEIARSIM